MCKYWALYCTQDAPKLVLLSNAKFIFPRATYKTAVEALLTVLFLFQLKTQLTETLSKLETEENERQKVAGDLYKVMLDFITLLVWFWDLRATLITQISLFNPGPAVSWPHSGGALQSDGE